MDWQGCWIWTDTPTPSRNAFVRFRREFDLKPNTDSSTQLDQAELCITADSRYVLYVNGEYIGQGPARSWPSHWKYDIYDVSPYLKPGANSIAVLVNYFGEGNFQYISAPAGLLAQLHIDGECVIATDHSWLTSLDQAFINPVARISVQEAFEEQYDARLDDGWVAPGYQAAGWRPAVEAPHAAAQHQLEPRDIALLTIEPVQPTRVVSVETVRSLPYHWHIYAKPYLHPTDLSSNRMVHHGYIYTQIWSDNAVDARLERPGKLKLNGRLVDKNSFHLNPGWNEVLVDFKGYTHRQDFSFVLDGPPGLRFACRGPRGGAPWAVMGPFGLTPALEEQLHNSMDDSTVVCRALVPTATPERGEAIWADGTLDNDTLAALFFQEVRPEDLPADSFLQSYTDAVVSGKPPVENVEALLSPNHEWAMVQPCEAGDVRILLDFGKEVVGFHRFEVAGAAGTVLDWHNFEFIQPDGRYNFAEGMNNTFRYTMRDGRQAYQTYVRRGFQYSYLTIRNLQAPLRIRLVEVLFNSYPQTHRGSFACSNAQLDRIWQVGAHSLRCCAEDTYVDCPTYEQTHWVGDARNEALVDWIVNGDPDLWFHCLEQTGHSLERSSLTESQVPSAWQNILPAWSFLWMRACREYLLFTGDTTRAKRLLGYVRRNIAGIKQHINEAGCFDIRAWNMFDWAAMDTPNRGVVTHQNCFAVQALNECAEMADWLSEPDDAQAWRKLAASIADAVNTALWNDLAKAYTDCLRNGKHSSVFSQQTQTAAYISGVAQGERATLCRQHMSNPPEGFVRSGSPFFAFFLLEALAREGRDDQFLAAILRDWGFMVDKGASTFWEMWSRVQPGGRLTRSHCHGWSAAPTFFLSTYTLGVLPLAPGFARVEVAPKPGGLTWCRGTVPTPQGIISVQWEDQPDKPFQLRIESPAGVELAINPPRQSANVSVNGVEWSF